MIKHPNNILSCLCDSIFKPCNIWDWVFHNNVRTF